MPVAKAKGGLDMTSAVKVTFVASLTAVRAKTEEYHTKYDHIWSAGHYQVKGPKGGLYFLGRAVMGKPKSGEQVKGTLKISNTKFLALQAGGTTEAWFTPEGSSEALLIGTLTRFVAR